MRTPIPLISVFKGVLVVHWRDDIEVRSKCSSLYELYSLKRCNLVESGFHHRTSCQINFLAFAPHCELRFLT